MYADVFVLVAKFKCPFFDDRLGKRKSQIPSLPSGYSFEKKQEKKSEKYLLFSSGGISQVEKIYIKL